MPKLEPKIIQKELEQGKIRPVYFLYGVERMKSRELLKRIQKAVLQDAVPNDFNFEKWDASETGISQILDAAQSFSMMGGTKLVVARNLHEVKDLEPLTDYLKTIEKTDAGKPEDIATVLVMLSKNFDARKKTSKVIQEVAAVIPCEGVEEQDREPWIDYLAKRRGVVLTNEERMGLRGQDPWSLEIIDQEIVKLELVGDDTDLRQESLLNGIPGGARDNFIDAIFCQDYKRGLELIHLFSAEMEVQLPFLGLLSWNLRQLKLFVMEQESRSSSKERRNPYLLRNLERWRKHWTSASVRDFEHALFQIDFSLKNTRLMGLGLWTEALMRQVPPVVQARGQAGLQVARP